MELNDKQKLVIKAEDKYIFLLAGAGSGKTRVIVEKIKHLLNKGYKEEILCITFTKKSASEMKKRLDNLKVHIHTFHSYAYELIKERRDFQIFEFNNEFTNDEILKVTNYKNSLKTTRKPKVFKRYEAYLKKRDLLDFDDLLLEASLYVEHHNFKYIFIDEFQDTNKLQFYMLEKMINEKVRVFAVGDPDQSIYGFRGANQLLINHFVKKYSATIYRLDLNYRSNQKILDIANNLIKNNINRFKKKLVSNKITNQKINVYLGQVEDINKEIINLIKTKKILEAVILYRNTFQIIYLKQLLKKHYLFGVKLYTYHEAKGLEFDDIIIYDASILPYDKDYIFSHKEEERRLFFVGITRAINNIYIFGTKKTKFLNELKIPYIYINNKK